MREILYKKHKTYSIFPRNIYHKKQENKNYYIILGYLYSQDIS
jgi:hypothetical protein